MVDVSTRLAPTIAGCVSSGTTLDGACGVAVSPRDPNLLFVAGTDGNSLAVADVSTRASPLVVAAVRLLAMDGPYGVAPSPDGTFVCVLFGAVNVGCDSYAVLLIGSSRR